MFEIVGNLIDIDLSEQEQDDCIMSFLVTRVRPESRSIFQECINKGYSIQMALFHAVINENINDALEISLRIQEDFEITYRFLEMCNTPYSKYKVEE